MLNMSPAFIINNKLNGPSANSIFFSHLTGRFNDFVVFSYCKDFFIGQLRSSTFLTPAFILATLLNHIFHIIFIRSKKEMAWLNAQSIIAFMTNKHPQGDGAIVQHPRYPVGPYDFFIKKNVAIARCSSACGPNPTSFSFFNLIPKSIHSADIFIAGTYVKL